MPKAARGYVLRTLSAGEPFIPSLTQEADGQIFLPLLYQFGEPNGFEPVVMGMRQQLAAASILPLDPGPGSGSGFVETFPGATFLGAFYTAIEPERYWGRRGVLARVPRSVVILTEPPDDYAGGWLEDLKEAVANSADGLADMRVHVYIAHPGRHGSPVGPIQTIIYQSAARHPLLAPCLVTGFSLLSYDDGVYQHYTYQCDTNHTAVVGGEVLYIHVARGADEISDYIELFYLNNVATGGVEPEFPPVPSAAGMVVAFNDTLELPNPTPPPAINDRARYTAVIYASKVQADGYALLAAADGYARLKVILAARPIQFAPFVMPGGYSMAAVRQAFIQQLPAGCPVESLILPADGASAGAAVVSAIVEFFTAGE